MATLIDNPPRELLVVFTRYPEPGRAKTRLIPALGAVGAAELQRKMTTQTLREADEWCRVGARMLIRDTGVPPVRVATPVRKTGKAISFDVSAHQHGRDARVTTMGRDRAVQIRVADGGEAAMGRLYGSQRDFVPQGDGDLGQRMDRAARDGFATGAAKVVIIGSDCPELTADILQDAFERLHTHDVVLGPANDGGYYLIGLGQFRPQLFQNIAWGTSQVFAQTMEAAQNSGLGAAALVRLNDVDRPEDLPIWDRAQKRLQQPPRISVIIPTLNEESWIARAIESASMDGVEIVVCDGGSTDGTVEMARSRGASIVLSSRGRAHQMNAGADAATGPILLFLHADSCLPADFVQCVHQTLGLPDTAAGAFFLRVHPPTFPMRIVAHTTNLRSRWLRVPYGDQAIFLARQTWQKVGGYRPLPIMEDIDLIARLKRHGQVRIAPSTVWTSGRRWQQHGAVRTTLLNQFLIVAYALGFSPQLLQRVRESGRLSALMALATARGRMMHGCDDTNRGAYAQTTHLLPGPGPLHDIA